MVEYVASRSGSGPAERRSAPVKRGCTTIRSPVERSSTTIFARRQNRSIDAPDTRLRSAPAATSRSTSPFRTTTPVIVRPRSSRSRSRAIVSVSGGSGTRLLLLAGNLAPADIRAELFALELNSLRVVETPPLRDGDGLAERAHGEHAAARGDEAAVGVARRTGVKDEDAVFRRGQGDRIAGARTLGIVCRGEHGGNAGTSCLRGSGAERLALGHREHEVDQARLAAQDGKERLRLGISEAAVELDDFGTRSEERRVGKECR